MTRGWAFCKYDSKFLYFIITSKPYDCAPLKIFITDSWLLSLHSLTFNPACANHILPLSSGICIHVPLFPCISFVKSVKTQSNLIYKWLPNTTHSCSAIKAFSPKQPIVNIQKLASYHQKNFQSLFKLRIDEFLSFCVSWQFVIPYCQDVQDLENFTLFVSQYGLSHGSIYSLPTSSCPLHHPVMLLKLYPKIFLHQIIPSIILFFCSQYLIIPIETFSLVSPNFSSTSF